MGEECGQCINYTIGWGIPSGPRVPMVLESFRDCVHARNIRAYLFMCTHVRACVRARVYAHVDLQRCVMYVPAAVEIPVRKHAMCT